MKVNYLQSLFLKFIFFFLQLIFEISSPCFCMAEIYPSKPLRWIVPFPAGGGTDLISRTLAQKLVEVWGQSIVVDNRPGSSGTMGLEVASKSVSDGYTLVLSQVANVALAPAFNDHLKYDPLKDLEPVTLVVNAPFVLLAHPSISANNIKDLISVARSHSGDIFYGSSGNGSFSHITGALNNVMAGLHIRHVPYKGVAMATSDLFSGRIGLYVSPIPPAIEWLKTGRVKALGITSTQRSNVLPGVEPIANVLPGFSSSNWYGVMVPAHTPKSIIRKINTDIVYLLGLTDVKNRLEHVGGEISPSSPEQFLAFIKLEISKWALIIKQSSITLD